MAKQKTIQEKWAQDSVTILKPAPEKKKTVKKPTKRTAKKQSRK